MNDDPHMITDVYGASRELSVSPDTIRRLVRRKQLPHFRVGRRLFFRHCDLERWIQAQVDASVREEK